MTTITKIAFLPIDNVLADPSARMNAAKVIGGRMNWAIAFDPSAVAHDTLIEGALADLADIEAQGYTVIWLSGRPEALRATTEDWLAHHVPRPASQPGQRRLLLMKPPAGQYIKTPTWRASMIQALAHALGAKEILVVDDPGVCADVQGDDGLFSGLCCRTSISQAALAAQGNPERQTVIEADDDQPF